MKNPLLWLAGSFALGISLAAPVTVSPFDLTRNIPLLLAAGIVCLLAGLVALRMGWRASSGSLALAGVVLAGSAAARLFEFRFPPDHVARLVERAVDLSEPVRIEGVLASSPLRTAYGLQFDLEVQRLETRGRGFSAQGKVRLRVQATADPESSAAVDSLRLEFGDAIRVWAQLRKPRIYQNPGSFDFRRWLEAIEDITWVGTVKSPLLVEKLPGAKPAGSRRFVEGVRQRLLKGIDRTYPPWSAEGRSGSVLKAVLLGDRSALDSDTIENFRRTGLYHLLVISGLHVGLLALLVGGLLRRLRLGETWRSASVFLFLLAYASLVEQRAPTLRATLMISVYLLARFLYREHAALNAIGFAALMLLVRRPPWLLEPGFELSFSAALLIAGLAVPILERTTEIYRRALSRLEDVELDVSLSPRAAQFRLDLRSLVATLQLRFAFFDQHAPLARRIVTTPAGVALWVANILLFSAVLQLGLLLPMAETFHRVTYAGIGLNALAIPVMTAILGLALPTVALAAVAPGMAAFPAAVLAFVMRCLFGLTDLPGLPAWLSYRVPEPPAWLAWGFSLAVVVAAWTFSRHLRLFWISLAALAVFAGLISFHPFSPRLGRGALELTALDCGGGDALFVALPDGTTMLVDGGGSRMRSAREGAFQGRRWDPGEDIVSPYLWSRGMKRIDILVLTHAHVDHLGGLTAVARNFRIGEFWHAASPPTPAFADLLAQLRKQGVPVRQMAAGEIAHRGDASIRILWPPLTRPVSESPSNDDSLVMRISYGDSSVLLTGDISSEVEEQLVRSSAKVESNVLKVAHHGARSSSSAEFLASVAPKVAVVSVESVNALNLPNHGTLERLRAAGARVWRTDADGAVTVEMRGTRISVNGYRASPAL